MEEQNERNAEKDEQRGRVKKKKSAEKYIKKKSRVT